MTTSRRSFLASSLTLAAALRANTPPPDFPEPPLTRHDRARLVTLLIALESLRRVAGHVIDAGGGGNGNLCNDALALRTSAEKLTLTFDGEVGADAELAAAVRAMGLPPRGGERTADEPVERYPGESHLELGEEERIVPAAECRAARLLLTALAAARQGLEWAAELPEEVLYESAARDLEGFRQIFEVFFNWQSECLPCAVWPRVTGPFGLPPDGDLEARLPMRRVREAAVRAAREAV
jgi:hypothetical protein